ncbi:MAG: hypothetical protein ACE5KU_03685 [Nitrososphaerales archaeon]
MSKNNTEQKPEAKSAETKAEKAPAPAPETASVTQPAPPAEEKKAAAAPEQVTAEKAAPERTSPPNHIFIGKKPVMSYAMSSLIQLTHSGEIVLKARGMSISRAVDVAEVVTKRLGNDAYAIKDVQIDTEKLGTGDDIRSVSTIEIVVGKK